MALEIIGVKRVTKYLLLNVNNKVISCTANGYPRTNQEVNINCNVGVQIVSFHYLFEDDFTIKVSVNLVICWTQIYC